MLYSRSSAVGPNSGLREPPADFQYDRLVIPAVLVDLNGCFCKHGVHQAAFKRFEVSFGLI